MGLNLESAQGATTSGLRADRRNAGARQDRWMLELEKAFTASVEQPDNPAGKGQRAGAETPARPHGQHAPLPMAQARAASGAAAPVRHEAGSKAPASDDATAAGTAAKTVSADGTKAAVPAPDAANDAASPAGGHVEAGTAAALTSVGAAAALTAASAGVSLRSAAGAAPAAAVSAPGIVARGGAHLRMAAQSFLAAGPNANPTPALATEEPALPEALATGTRMPADGKPFDKRAMHVFVDEQGVHAFIRDAALQATQLRGLMQALSAEVATSGRQLATLTINGRAVDQAAARGVAGDDEHLFQQYADGEFAASLSYSIASAYKGHP